MSGFKITCYGKTEEYPESKRLEQMAFYEDCIYSSEGSERDRYVSIFFALINLKNECDDEWKWKFGQDYTGL